MLFSKALFGLLLTASSLFCMQDPFKGRLFERTYHVSRLDEATVVRGNLLISKADINNDELLEIWLNNRCLFEVKFFNKCLVNHKIFNNLLLRPKLVLKQLEELILYESYHLINVQNRCHIYTKPDQRSENLSKLIAACLLAFTQQHVDKQRCVEILNAECNRIACLPYNQMRQLVLWAVRNGMSGGSDLLQIVYSWLHKDNTIDHITYPKSWLRVKLRVK